MSLRIVTEDEAMTGRVDTALNEKGHSNLLPSHSPQLWTTPEQNVHPQLQIFQNLIHSFKIFHRLAQLCFTRFVLDLGGSCKSIIASLNRLMYWKVVFQSLLWEHFW